jgi:hypothetical protein
MDKDLVLKIKKTVERMNTVLNHTKGAGGTTVVFVQTLIGFTVMECVGVIGQRV